MQKLVQARCWLHAVFDSKSASICLLSLSKLELADKPSWGVVVGCVEMWLLQLFVGSGAENWGKINEEGVISEGSIFMSLSSGCRENWWLASSTHPWSIFLRHFLVPHFRCWSCRNILSSARFVSVLVPNWFQCFMTVFPKMLKRHSHDAELALIDRKQFARHISGIDGCPEWQKLLYNSRTFSLTFWKTWVSHNSGCLWENDELYFF